MSTRLEEYNRALELEGQIICELDWYLLSVHTQSYNTLLSLMDPISIQFKPVAKPHISIMKQDFPPSQLSSHT